MQAPASEVPNTSGWRMLSISEAKLNKFSRVSKRFLPIFSDAAKSNLPIGGKQVRALPGPIAFATSGIVPNHLAQFIALQLSQWQTLCFDGRSA